MEKKKGLRPRKFIPGWDYLEYLLVRLLMGLLGALPLAVMSSLGRNLGELSFYLWGSRRQIALANLDIAYGASKSKGEKRQIAKKAFGSITLSLLEYMRVKGKAPKRSRTSNLLIRSQTLYPVELWAPEKGQECILLILN